jgi:hypothetical protein
MSFNGFRERSLNRRRKPKPTPEPEPEKLLWPFRHPELSFVIAFVIIVGWVFAMMAITSALSPHASHQTSSWQQEDVLFSTDTKNVDLASYGVHLNAVNKIDKIYDRDQLQRLSKKKLAADNVVLFYHDDSGFEVDAPTSVTIDGVSHTFKTEVSLSIGDMYTARNDYNALVAKQPGISLRGKNNVGSLEQYVLSNISQTLFYALKTGKLAPPTAVYDGTGTQYNNDDVATAYKAGINANLFAHECNVNPSSTDVGPCTASYDFSCKTAGIQYTNWSAFSKNLIAFVPNTFFYVGNPSQNQVSLNTALPCRIAASDVQTGPASQQSPPLNEGGNN